MTTGKAIGAMMLAVLISAPRLESQERIELDASSRKIPLHAPGQLAAPVTEKLGRAAGRETYYLSYVLDNSSDHSDWILSAFMDSDTKIEILEYGEERSETRTIFSRTLPLRKEASLGGPYAVRLDVPRKSSKRYLVFLSDNRPVLLTLWSADAYAAHSVRRHLMLGLFYGAVLLLVLSQLSFSLALRDRAFAWFGLFILFSALSLCYWDGIAIETFHPPWLPASETLYYFGFANLSMIFGYSFLRRFADLRNSAPRLDRVVIALTWLQAALGAIVPWTRPAFFPWLVAVLAMAHASIQILGGILAARRAVPSARPLIAGFILQLAAAFLLLLRALGLTIIERLEFAVALLYPAILASAIFIAIALTGRIRALDRARDAAERRSDAFRAFLSDLSRDLMVPMRLLMASISAQERRSPPSRELSALRRNADKLARGMERLLGEPHPKRGAPPTQAGESTDLGAVVRDRVSAFSAAAPEGAAGPLVELEPRLAVEAEAASVERAVDRILGEIMRRGGWNEGSRIAARQVRGRIELRVEMSSADCGDGTALRLEEDPGDPLVAPIERGSLPGGGFGIRISLPAAAAFAKPRVFDQEAESLPWSGQAPPRPEGREPGVTAEGETLSRILIVSDESALRTRLAARLSGFFETSIAEDAATALDMLASEGEYGVVVLDLPGGIAEGHEVLRAARADSRFARTAFIIAADREEREGRREVLAEGSVVLLSRPLDLEEAAMAAADLSRRGAEEKRRQEDEYRRRLELMLGGLSHAIKNPLSGITGPLACLRRLPDGALAPEADKYLGQMEESAGRIGAILRDVASALFAGPLRSEAISLDLLLGGIADIIRTARPQTAIVRDQAPGVEVRGDPDAARTIFENVLMNAAEAMEGRGEIRVSISQASERIEIEIRDRGPGIPQADLSRIFDPFFSTKGLGRGLGLGLAIVRGLAADMAWEVSVSSKAGEGTAFRISAPRFRPGKGAS